MDTVTSRARRIVVPGSILIAGDRGSGRTTELLRIWHERYQHNEPPMFLCSAPRMVAHTKMLYGRMGHDPGHLNLFIMAASDLPPGLHYRIAGRAHHGIICDDWDTYNFRLQDEIAALRRQVVAFAL